MKKLLITVAVHGDEGFSIPVAERLQSEFPQLVEYVICNPKALEQNVRYTDIDLNRVFPGDATSSLYEYQRAQWLMENYISKRDEYVHIDIHGTVADCGIFTIVTNPTPGNLVLACSLPTDNIVIWEGKYYKEREGYGAITEFSDCGVAIECGMTIGKNEEEVEPVQEKLYSILRDFVQGYIAGNTIGNTPKQNLWQVDGKYMVSSGFGNLKDFDLYEYEGRTFSPLLAGQYVNNGIYCYTMQPLSLATAQSPICIEPVFYAEVKETQALLTREFPNTLVRKSIFTLEQKQRFYVDFVERLERDSSQMKLRDKVRSLLTDPVSRYDIEYSTDGELSAIIGERICYQGTHYRFLSPVLDENFLFSLLDDMKSIRGQSTSYTVVDVGCGNGALLNQYARLCKDDNVRLLGVDISQKSAHFTEQTVLGVRTYGGAFVDTAFDETEIALLFLSYFIDRDENQYATLSKAVQSLRKGGLLVLEGLFPCVLEDTNGVSYGSANVTRGISAAEDIILVVQVAKNLGIELQEIVCGNRFVYSLDGFEDLPSYILVFKKQ